MLQSSEQPASNPPQAMDRSRPRRALASKLDEIVELAETLDPNDRTRLIAAVWESLPEKNRRALSHWFQNVHEAPGVQSPQPGSISRRHSGPSIGELLFDPSGTSDLYSAPKRFDLATIFVVTAAYSILFGVMAGLDVYFGPLTKVAVGIFVTVIGVCQALNQHIANPRGVSVIAGAVTLPVILILSRTLGFSRDSFFSAIIIGPICGALCGYLAGTVVAGVFLVADLLRKQFTGPTDSPAGQTGAEAEKESPWD